MRDRPETLYGYRRYFAYYGNSGAVYLGAKRIELNKHILASSDCRLLNDMDVKIFYPANNNMLK